jgi:hypothetical protein
MKKIFHLTVIVVALSILASAGTLWAGPVAPVCPAHCGKCEKCIEKDGDFYCNRHKEVRENKLVPGRAGLLTWVFVPTSRVRTEKCADGVHEDLK